MKEVNIISAKYSERLNEVLNESWKIFKSQFINERHNINKEAPFQHHFAQIIRSVGHLYSISKNDLFIVDLETKSKNKVKEKYKYIDITCEFVDKINCAIELKFKTSKQGAQDHGRIDTYIDIEALEILTTTEYQVGRFYMITDSKPYINESRKGVGTVFSTHHGFTSKRGNELWYNSKGRENIKINLRDSYSFEWEKINDWYFLELTINNSNDRFIWKEDEVTIIKKNDI